MRRSKSFLPVLVVAVLAVVLGTPSKANYQYVHYASRNAPFSPIYEKFDLNALVNKTVTYFVSDQSPVVYGANDSFGSVLSQVRQAVSTWNEVSSSDLRVAFGGLESYTSNPTTAAPGNSLPNAATPGGDVIFVDLPPGILGMGAPTASQVAVNGFFPITRGIVMLSRDTSLDPLSLAGPSYLEEFFTTAVHEIGHSLGLQHTWTGSAMSQGVVRNTSRARPLDADDIAGLSVLYGKPGWGQNYGSISGRVSLAGGQNVSMASVVAISANGPAVSTLTNPDGTYRIDGLPPNLNYMVYVHPLPPDAVVANGEGLRLAVDQNGQQFQPTAGAFQTVFFPGTLDPQQAISINIGKASVVGSVDFSVQPRTAVPTYNVVTFCRLNTATRAYTVTGASTELTLIGYPAFVDSTRSLGVVIAQAKSPAVLPVPQSMSILGGFAPAPLNSPTYPKVLNYEPGSDAAYFTIPLGAGIGPRHLVFNFGNDIYVLPNGVELVQKGPPLITAVTPNADGSVTIAGAGFGLDSTVFFDGLKAVGSFTGSEAQGSITVTPPPGTAGQSSTVSVYNADGQNSMILAMILTPQNLPTYAYPAGPAPQLTGVSITSLPAASSAVVDITALNTNFVDGQVTVGFGSDDVTVRRVWVLSTTHLMANVVVAAGATLGTSEISVISGLQVIPLANAFQTLPARPGLPFVGLPVVNADVTQQTVFPGSIASIYGLNLALTPTSAQLTLNDVPVQIQFASATQINFFVPANFTTGPATLRLNNGSTAAFPILVQIDGPPPQISGVTNQSNLALAGISVGAGELVNVIVTGLDPGVLTNPSRVQVAVSGVMMPVLSISPLANGQFQIQFIVTQSFGTTQVPVMVWVDGSSSLPVNISVR